MVERIEVAQCANRRQRQCRDVEVLAKGALALGQYGIGNQIQAWREAGSPLNVLSGDGGHGDTRRAVLKDGDAR
jgi:hypothetical protein